MASAKTHLVNALLGSSALTALLGGPFVYFEYPDASVDTSKMKNWIIYYELSSVPQMADGREYFVEATYQVTVISEKSTTKISELVADILGSANFERQMSVDAVEEDVPRLLYTRSSQYRIVMEV